MKHIKKLIVSAAVSMLLLTACGESGDNNKGVETVPIKNRQLYISAG